MKAIEPFIHHSPFTIHHSPFTIHHSPFTIPEMDMHYPQLCIPSTIIVNDSTCDIIRVWAHQISDHLCDLFNTTITFNLRSRYEPFGIFTILWIHLGMDRPGLDTVYRNSTRRKITRPCTSQTGDCKFGH